MSSSKDNNPFTYDETTHTLSYQNVSPHPSLPSTPLPLSYSPLLLPSPLPSPTPLSPSLLVPLLVIFDLQKITFQVFDKVQVEISVDESQTHSYKLRLTCINPVLPKTNDQTTSSKKRSLSSTSPANKKQQNNHNNKNSSSSNNKSNGTTPKQAISSAKNGTKKQKK